MNKHARLRSGEIFVTFILNVQARGALSRIVCLDADVPRVYGVYKQCGLLGRDVCGGWRRKIGTVVSFSGVKNSQDLIANVYIN